MSDMLGMVVRMLVSLGVVLALMYVAARLMSRTRGVSRGDGPRAKQRPVRAPMLAAVGGAVQRAKRAKRTRRGWRAEPQLELVARQPLGKTASVAVVRVADRTLLLGVTDTAVRLLSELDSALSDEESDDEGRGDALPEDLKAVVGLELARGQARSRSASVSVLDQLRERTVRRA